MAEKKSRAAARKIKDKWKAKVWYNLLAPEMFNKQLLGETPTDTPDKLVGRVTEVTVQDLTGDFSKMHIKLAFRVKPMAITDRRIQSSKQRVLRAIMARAVSDVAAKQSIGEFVKGIISGDLAKTIALGCKPIHPVSRVEVRKSEVWAMGELPPPTEAPAEAAEVQAPAPPPVEPV